MDVSYIFILISFGVAMGLLGGLLGIGGAMFLIPALTFAFGENQHLYQAATMICIFFVSAAALVAHRKADVISKPILVRMLPTALVGIVAGVAMSNCVWFEGSRDYILSRIFGGFLTYVVIYNCFRLYLSFRGKVSENPEPEQPKPEKKLNAPLAYLAGLLTGFASGLLGIGAGTVSTPLQQLCLKTPIRTAMSNSAALIVGISWLGAAYKNFTLGEHGLHFSDSFQIAILVIPGSIIGGYVGGHLMHILPKNIVRGFFIVACAAAAFKLLTVTPS